MKGYINKIETAGLVDGPGVRIVIFTQGCKMRCLYCQNPETWAFKEGSLMTPQEVINKVLKYKNYMINSGGITFSGGEPLMQPEFLLETLNIAVQEGIHTCLDTAGLGINLYEEIVEKIDLVLLDIKGTNEQEYKNITGVDQKYLFEFIKVLNKHNKKVWARYVVVPNLNDNEKNMLELKKIISTINNVEKIELLPYHTLGLDKYKELNIKYKLDGVKSLSKSRLNELYDILEKI